MASPRNCEGLVLPGGLVIPPFPQQFFGADDSWGFTTAGGGGVHPGIETATMLNRRMAVRRVHFPFGTGPGGGRFGWPTAAMVGWTSLTNPSVIPMIAHGSQGAGANGFPIKTIVNNGKGYANTATVNGHQGIDRIAAGEFDAAYSDSFSRIKAAGGPWLFNLYMEMDLADMGAFGDYQGGANGPGQTSYIACYRHLRALADSVGATNMIWVWCPSAYDPHNNKLTYYPGDDAVHVIMEDVYRQNYAGNVDDIYNFAKQHGKPFGIAESGFYDTPQGNQPSPVQTMVAEFAAAMTSTTYAENCFWVPWNQSGISPNVVDSTAAGLAAYQKVASSANFGAFYTPGGGGGGPLTPPSNSTLPALSDTTPAVGEAITVVHGSWTGNPVPTLASQVQIADSLIAAGLQPLYAMGGNISGSTLTDDSGHGLDGNIITASGGTTPAQVSGPPSIGGNGVSFDGKGSRIEVPDDGSLNPIHWTLSAWIKLANPPGDTDPVHQRYELAEKAGAYWFNIRYDTSPAYKFRIGAFFGPTAIFDNLDSVTPIVPGTWAHVCGTYDGVQMKTYINAALDSAAARTGDSNSSAEKLVIGSKHRVIQQPALLEAFMHGSIAGLCVFGRALSASEVTTVSALTFPIWADVGASYTPVSGDIGDVLRVREVATNSQGSASAVSAPSGAITTGVASRPINTTPPALSDATPIVGETISITQGVWTGSPTPALVSNLQIGTGSGPWTDLAATYTILTSDFGQLMRVKEVATNPSGSSTAFSSVSAAIASNVSGDLVNDHLTDRTVATGWGLEDPV